MNPVDFVESVKLGENKDKEGIISRLSDPGTVRLLHAFFGYATEAGEFGDNIKRHIFYGKEIDRVNLEEELGDLMWYIGLACIELDVPLERVMQKNYEKLRARYGDSWSKEAALNRDLEKERQILEKE